MDDGYERYEHEMESIDEQIKSQENHGKDEEQDNSHALLLPSEVRHIKLIRQSHAPATTYTDCSSRTGARCSTRTSSSARRTPTNTPRLWDGRNSYGGTIKSPTILVKDIDGGRNFYVL